MTMTPTEALATALCMEMDGMPHQHEQCDWQEDAARAIARLDEAGWALVYTEAVLNALAEAPATSAYPVARRLLGLAGEP